MDLPLLPEGSAVLEMGCGNSKTLSALLSDWKIVALDVSRGALQLDRKVGRDAHFILADASRLRSSARALTRGVAPFPGFLRTGYAIRKGRRGGAGNISER